jgi:hypothetical protein
MYSNLVSDDRENIASLISKLLTYLGIVITFQFLGFVTTFAYSSYLNRAGSFAQSFVFQSPDEPPVSVGFLRPQPFGNHFFGDYLQIYADVKTSGNGGYFGASQLFLLLVTKIPYYLSLMFLFAIAILLLYVSARLLLNKMGLTKQLALLISGFLFTQPVLFAIDRGQIHILLFTFLLLGLTLSIKDGGNKTWGAVLIAAAVSMKLTPVFFLLLFVRKRAWRELKVSLVSLIGLVLIPFAYLDSGFGAWRFVQGFIVGSKAELNTYSSVEYFTGNLAFNNSFKLLSYHFSQMNSGLGIIGGFVYDHYLLFAVLLSVFLCWLIIQKSISQFESVLLMAIASSLLIPIAGGYTLMVFILPIVIILADNDFTFSRLNIIYCCYLGIVLMPKQIDFRLQTFEPYAITLGGILNPSLSLIVVLFISCRCFFSADSQNSDSKTPVPVF